MRDANFEQDDPGVRFVLNHGGRYHPNRVIREKNVHNKDEIRSRRGHITLTMDILYRDFDSNLRFKSDIWLYGTSYEIENDSVKLFFSSYEMPLLSPGGVSLPIEVELLFENSKLLPEEVKRSFLAHSLQDSITHIPWTSLGGLHQPSSTGDGNGNGIFMDSGWTGPANRDWLTDSTSYPNWKSV